ncbi:MAG: ral stress protein [Bacteroidetes bacterium]|jgi:bacillithiol system protein YtxJ|nr:ral stress protein [Bacteroidota bacterium]
MKWNELLHTDQLEKIDRESNTTPVLILKHSTRCSISSVALSRIESSWKEEYGMNLKPYYLDLLSHRDVSAAIATRYGIMHESPQVLVISGGKCIYSETHSGIRLSGILEHTK